MTGLDALDYLKEKFDNMIIPDLSGGIYLLSKPARVDEPNFIVLNALPVTESILQKAQVNANIFVDDIEPGTPDNGKMKRITNTILADFPFAESGSDIQAYLLDTATYPDSDNNRHFVNVRMEIMMLND